jgi:uncharacterized protein
MDVRKYEWDERKRLANIEKHDIDFFDVHYVLEGIYLSMPAGNTTEPRFRAIGPLNDILMTIIYTIRGDAIRVISARRARRNERREYQKLHAATD